jgi:hypothetical protein
MRRYLLHLRREEILGLGEVLAANEISINTEPVQVGVRFAGARSGER